MPGSDFSNDSKSITWRLTVEPEQEKHTSLTNSDCACFFCKSTEDFWLV